MLFQVLQKKLSLHWHCYINIEQATNATYSNTTFESTKHYSSFKIFISPLARVRSIAMSVSAVCLSACLSICSLAYLKDRTSKLNEISLHVTRGSGSVLLRRQCNMLCTSGFVDDVMFAHNWPYGMRLIWCILKVTHQAAAPGAKCDVYDCLVRIAYVRDGCR